MLKGGHGGGGVLGMGWERRGESWEVAEGLEMVWWDGEGGGRWRKMVFGAGVAGLLMIEEGWDG